MILGHSAALVVMSGQALDIFLVSTKKSAHFDFPPNTVSHLDVVDPEMFAKSLTKFIEALGIGTQSYVLLLSPELTFQTQLKPTSKDASSDLQQEFLQLLPFPKSDLSVITIETKTKITFLATPASLFGIVKDTLQENGWKNENILPFQVLEKVSLPLTATSIQQVMKQAHDKSRYSFPKPNAKEEVASSEEEDKPETTSKPSPTPEAGAEDDTEAAHDSPEPQKDDSKTLKLLLIALGLILVFGGLFIAWTYRDNIPFLPKAEKDIVPKAESINPTSTPVASPTVSDITQSVGASPVPKSELTFQIENASGVTGAAGKLKTSLVAQGYSGKITTTNSNSVTGSSVTFSPKVNAATQTELLKFLSTKLSNLVESTATPAADVRIIIGK